MTSDKGYVRRPRPTLVRKRETYEQFTVGDKITVYGDLETATHCREKSPVFQGDFDGVILG